MSARPVSLAHETARRAVRAAFAAARHPLQQTAALADMIHTIVAEAAALGAENVSLLDGQTRALATTIHSLHADHDARTSLFKSASALCWSQLDLLDALNIPRAPFARATMESNGAKGEKTS